MVSRTFTPSNFSGDILSQIRRDLAILSCEWPSLEAIARAARFSAWPTRRYIEIVSSGTRGLPSYVVSFNSSFLGSVCYPFGCSRV